MNLTPDKRIKSLRSCSDLPTGNSGCAWCMFASLYEPACTDLLLRHAADQIERDQKEIADLRAALEKATEMADALNKKCDLITKKLEQLSGAHSVVGDSDDAEGGRRWNG